MPCSEDTIYILEGEGTVTDFDHDLKLDFQAGDVIHVPPGVKHAVAADKGVAGGERGWAVPRRLCHAARRSGALPEDS